MNPQDIIATAAKYLGTQDFNNFCQKFIEQITQGRTGLFPSAIAAWQGQQDKAVKGTQGIQPGDVVYFAPDQSNNNYGHTGIYAGNGRFISATYNGVQEIDLSQWLKQTGQKILGYIPQGNKTAVDSARLNGNTINNAIASVTPKQFTRQLKPIQIPQQSLIQFTNQPSTVNPNISMPSIQNPAGQATSYPMQDMMRNISQHPPGQQTSSQSSIPTLPAGYRGTSYQLSNAVSSPQGVQQAAGGNINPYSATNPQQQNQQTIDQQQQALQQSVSSYTPGDYTPPTPQSYTFGNITVQG